MAVCNQEAILKEIRGLNVQDCKETKKENYYHHTFIETAPQQRQRYPYPYKLIDCDDTCKKKIKYKVELANRSAVFIKKNEDATKESKNTTNKAYTLFYIWFIVMVVIIYVLIIAVFSENSYHPLMNIIIIIFLRVIIAYIFSL